MIQLTVIAIVTYTAYYCACVHDMYTQTKVGSSVWNYYRVMTKVHYTIVDTNEIQSVTVDHIDKMHTLH